MTTTPQHCPGYESFKDLKSFVCKCNSCGEEKEIFSDEFKKAHKCVKCGTTIDFTSCSYEAGGGTSTPR
jgi:ribosomal protein S27E